MFWVVFGVVVGLIVIELLFWVIVGDDVVWNLLCDVCFMVVIVMGLCVFGVFGGFDLLVMGVVMFVYVVFLVVYVVVLVCVIWCLLFGFVLFVGGVFGFFLYGVNLYGFMMIFLWFIVVCDMIMLIVYLMFGIMVVVVYCVV